MKLLTFSTHIILSFAFGLCLRAQDAGRGSVIAALPPPPVAGGQQTTTTTASDQPAGAVDGAALVDSVFNGVDTSLPQATPRPANVPLVPQAGAPLLPPPSETVAQTTTADVKASANLKDLHAKVSESRYPETVRRQGSGYVSMNVPPGWKMVRVRTLLYNPAPTIPLANGETYAVQSSPYVLIPAAEANRVPINPRALQVLHNFYLASEELTTQLKDALKSNNSVTRIE